MNTQLAINLAGGASKLADLLGITKGAVSQWGETLPESRVWQLKVQRPEWFDEQKPRQPLTRQAQAATKSVAA